MGDWNVSPESGDIVLRTPEKEFLRLKPNGTFFINDRPAENDTLVANALRWWLTGTGATSWSAGHSLDKDVACHPCWTHEPNTSPLGCRHAKDATAVVSATPCQDVVLSVASTAVVTPQQSIKFRAKTALESLKTSVKERESTRAKAIAALADLLTTFQKVMRQLIVEVGLVAKALGQERPSSLFDAGNTLSVNGIFGMEWTGGEYVLYHNGNRRSAGPGEVATYVVDHHPGLDIEAAMDTIASGLEAARDNVTKGLGVYERIRATSTEASKRLKADELKELAG